jgi:hypothetical protein
MAAGSLSWRGWSQTFCKPLAFDCFLRDEAEREKKRGDG